MKLLILTFIAACCLTASAVAQTNDKLIGQWQDAAHPDRQIDVYRQNGRYYGKAIPTASAATKAGVIILNELSWVRADNTYKGTLIDPDSGASYPVSVSMPDDRTFTFRVGKFVFHRTFRFRRINS